MPEETSIAFAGSMVVLLAFCVQAVNAGCANDFTPNRASLRGLTGVCVVVEELDDELDKAGLKRNELEAEMQALVRSAGIRVVNKKEFYESKTAGLLYIAVKTTSQESNDLAATVDVSLKQLVSLLREPTVRTLAETWSSEELTPLKMSEMVRYIRGAVAEHVDRFIAAYPSANPK